MQELPFLYILIRKQDDGELSISVNRKEINMDRIVNFTKAVTKYLLTVLTHTTALPNRRAAKNASQNNRYANKFLPRYTKITNEIVYVLNWPG